MLVLPIAYVFTMRQCKKPNNQGNDGLVMQNLQAHHDDDHANNPQEIYGDDIIANHNAIDNGDSGGDRDQNQENL